MIRDSPNNLRQTLFFRRLGRKAPERRGEEFENQTGASSQARNQKRKGCRGGNSISLFFLLPFPSHIAHSGLVPISFSTSFHMNLVVFSAPFLALVALLSFAAPLPHVAGPTANEHPLVMAYYPDWASYSLPPEKIDFGRFDWIDFAFALPDQSFALTWDDPLNAPALLQRLVTSAHDAGKFVKLSVGGWTGSQLRARFDRCILSHDYIQLLLKALLRRCCDRRKQGPIYLQHLGSIQPFLPRRDRHRLGVSRSAG
jgi:hypothetical protein